MVTAPGFLACGVVPMRGLLGLMTIIGHRSLDGNNKMRWSLSQKLRAANPLKDFSTGEPIKRRVRHPPGSSSPLIHGEEESARVRPRWEVVQVVHRNVPKMVEMDETDEEGCIITVFVFLRSTPPT